MEDGLAAKEFSNDLDREFADLLGGEDSGSMMGSGDGAGGESVQRQEKKILDKSGGKEDDQDSQTTVGNSKMGQTPASMRDVDIDDELDDGGRQQKQDQREQVEDKDAPEVTAVHLEPADSSKADSDEMREETGSQAREVEGGAASSPSPSPAPADGLAKPGTGGDSDDESSSDESSAGARADAGATKQGNGRSAQDLELVSQERKTERSPSPAPGSDGTAESTKVAEAAEVPPPPEATPAASSVPAAQDKNKGEEEDEEQEDEEEEEEEEDKKHKNDEAEEEQVMLAVASDSGSSSSDDGEGSDSRPPARAREEVPTPSPGPPPSETTLCPEAPTMDLGSPAKAPPLPVPEVAQLTATTEPIEPLPPKSPRAASGGIGLLAMMDTAVASIEQGGVSTPAATPSKDLRSPESAEAPAKLKRSSASSNGSRASGAESGGPAGARTKRRSAEGAKGLAKGKAHAKAASRILGREDAFDKALREGDSPEAPSAPPSSSAGAADSAAGGSSSSAAAGTPLKTGQAAALTGGGLAQLRKAYADGTSSKPVEEAGSPDVFDLPSGGGDAEQPCGPRFASSTATMDPSGTSPTQDSGGPPDGEDAALQDEWAQIEAQTNEIRAREPVDRGRIQANDDIMSTPLSYNDVQQWVLSFDIDQEALKQLDAEQVEYTSCGCFGRHRGLTDIPGLDVRLRRDKDLVFTLRSTDFDFNEPMHYRMLRTAYTKLTRNKVCPMIGKHWEVLGFQHTDPRTDLNRSGRLLNVLHLFFFFSHHFDILKNCYLLAQDEEQNFPLACVCINLTQMVIGCLIEGRLSSLCNASDKGVFDTTCKIFSGALYHFYARWKSMKRTIRDTEATFKEVRALLERRPLKLLQGLAKGVEEQKAKGDASKFEFTELDFTGRAPQAGAGAPPKAALVPKRLKNYVGSE